MDFMVSDHRPAVKEDKEREFEYATFGTSQLSMAANILNSQNKLSIEKLVEILSDKTSCNSDALFN